MLFYGEGVGVNQNYQKRRVFTEKFLERGRKTPSFSGITRKSFRRHIF